MVARQTLQRLHLSLAFVQDKDFKNAKRRVFLESNTDTSSAYITIFNSSFIESDITHCQPSSFSWCYITHNNTCVWFYHTTYQYIWLTFAKRTISLHWFWKKYVHVPEKNKKNKKNDNAADAVSYWRVSVSEQGLFQTSQGTRDAYLMLMFWAVSCSCACTTFKNWMEGIYKLKKREKTMKYFNHAPLSSTWLCSFLLYRLRMGVRTRILILGLGLHFISLLGTICKPMKNHKIGLTAPT